MGQRLVITANYKNQEIAKIYFHWSAYTVSALIEAYDLINAINISDCTTIEDLQLQLIRYCESNGGSVDGGAYSEEMKYVKFIFPKEEFKGNGNRNQGLIAISDVGRDEMQRYGEGDLIINFDSQEVSNYCYIGWDLAGYKNYRKDESTKKDKIHDAVVNNEETRNWYQSALPADIVNIINDAAKSGMCKDSG